VLREYVEAMRALWTQEEAAYDGEFVRFGPSWAFPKPAQPHVPLIIGAGGGPKTFAWIARTADGWMTTPREDGIVEKAAALQQAWAEAGRGGRPDIRVLIAAKPTPDDIAAWAEAGVSELIWGVPDTSPDEVLAYLDRLAARLATPTPR
jgi:alkanesulfonate monooxygenase SsuD/methylene tetrahydromethanopterin reductase-like flavin-dependent oxidoreductase (luciferase family)